MLKNGPPGQFSTRFKILRSATLPRYGYINGTVCNVIESLYIIFIIHLQLSTVLRPAQEFFTDMETSPLLVKGCKRRWVNKARHVPIHKQVIEFPGI
jgi:hypothetical protein